MNDLSEKAKTLLFEGDYTFALIGGENGEKTFTSDLKGVSPLLTLLNVNPDLLKGAYIADKIVGKAAALLMIYGGVKNVYAVTMSVLAIEMFEKHSVPFLYDNSVPLVKNRTGEGLCPMEAAVMFTDNPERAYEIIRETSNRRLQQSRPPVE